jgi:hypothetical protein
MMSSVIDYVGWAALLALTLAVTRGGLRRAILRLRLGLARSRLFLHRCRIAELKQQSRLYTQNTGLIDARTECVLTALEDQHHKLRAAVIRLQRAVA